MLGASWEQTWLYSASGGASRAELSAGRAEPLALLAPAAPFNFRGKEQ